MDKTALFLKGRRGPEPHEEARAALEPAMGPVELVPARRTTVRRGEKVTASTLLVSGVMCRYIDDRHGYRQLVAIHFPGDFIDLHGYALARLDHDIATITDAEVSHIEHEALSDLIRGDLRLGRTLWFSSVLDGAMHREWIFQLGRLDSAGRIAHLMCESHARLHAIGRVRDGAFDWPLTQADMGEATGMTNIHVNRVLGRLRDDGLLDIRERRAQILDLDRLRQLGQFTPDYLYLA